MATSAGEVEVKLTLDASDFQKMLSQSQSALGGFDSAIAKAGMALVAAFSFTKIAEFFKNSLNAYAESQLSVAKLVAALGSHNLATDENVTHLEKQAKALEQLTGIEDKTITGVQSLLVQFGLSGPILDKATQATVDLSVGMGIDLQHAATLMAKAFEGNTTMLARYGLKVNETLPPQEKFAALMELVQQRFGAVAAAQAGTFTGQINAMGNAFQHLMEAVGKLLAGPAGDIMKWLITIIDKTTEFVPKLAAVNEFVINLQQSVTLAGVSLRQGIISALVELVSLLIDAATHIPVIGQSFLVAQANMVKFKVALEQTQKTERDGFKTHKDDTAAWLETQRLMDLTLANSGKQGMDVSSAMNKWIRDQNMLTKDEFLKNLKEEDQGYSDFYNTFITTQKDMWEFAASLSNNFFQGFGDGFAKMVVEGKNFSDSMKELFKNLAEQVISYVIQMIAKMLILLALETATGMGPGAGMAVSAFGAFAAGGVIDEPSVIFGLRSGSRTIAGESGPESVTPMNGAGPTSSGGSGQSGNITINIQGQFLEADSNTWNKLMREKIIPQIRRATMSNPTGPFNRTRGVV